MQKSAQAHTAEKLYMLSNMQTKMCAVPLNAGVGVCVLWGMGSSQRPLL